MADPHAPYTVYKADMSYFSGKFEAYLRYKNIPHSAVDVDLKVMDSEIYPSTGSRKVPAVKTADGQWLFDTTPMMQWFEDRYPVAPVIPDDPALAFVAALIEDYGDEWLWRPSMWWRWEMPAGRRLLSWRIGSLVNLGSWVTRLYGAYYAYRQRQEWLWKDGVDKHNAAAVRDLYLAELDTLQAVFEQQSYLLGSHPSIADFGYYGSMFRHFGNDPDPSEVMRRRAPAVHEWLARLWNESPQRLGENVVWQWPKGEHWQPLLKRIAGDYLPYLQQNALAFQKQQSHFDFSGHSLSFKRTVTTDYRVLCREKLQAQYAALSDADQQRVTELFLEAGGLAALQADGVIASNMAEEYELPRPARTAKQRPTPLKYRFTGQARN